MVHHSTDGAVRRAAALSLGLLVLLSGCGLELSRTDDRSGPTTTTGPDMFCDLVSIVAPEMRADGLSFADLVEDASPDGLASGYSAGIAFAMMARGRNHAGRFRPVLGYLADRSVSSMPSGNSKAPKLTDGIRANAEELDRFLADGGCG